MVIFNSFFFYFFFKESLLQTSCKEMSEKNDDMLKKNVSIRFDGEQGMVSLHRVIFIQIFRSGMNPFTARSFTIFGHLLIRGNVAQRRMDGDALS